MPKVFVYLHGKSSENLDYLSCLLLSFYFPKLEILKKLLWVLLTDSQHSEIKLVASYSRWGMP